MAVATASSSANRRPVASLSSSQSGSQLSPSGPLCDAFSERHVSSPGPKRTQLANSLLQALEHWMLSSAAGDAAGGEAAGGVPPPTGDACGGAAPDGLSASMAAVCSQPVTHTNWSGPSPACSSEVHRAKPGPVWTHVVNSVAHSEEQGEGGAGAAKAAMAAVSMHPGSQKLASTPRAPASSDLQLS